MSRRRMMLKKSELPVGYRRCEYLESTKTQWIDTRIIPVFGDEINVKAKRLGDVAPIFYAGANNQFTIFPSGAGNVIYTKYFQSGTAKTFFSKYFEKDGLFHNFTYNKNGLVIDGIKVCGISDNRLESNSPLQLFRTNTAYGELAMKKLTLSREDEILLNLIPALDPSGRPCMYDTITRQPFYNRGTGEFLCELSGGGIK